ncbi:MAG: DUF1640 domain-containing protein [Methylococcales bacterium]|nr:DUF1640 domain-containing protein [Methylococcales bacterium]MDD5755190.1 DUF1640 domain-containing protein [Methylococcales bacterium]
MSATVLNIHEFYNELKNAGFNEQQAEVIANIQGKTANAAIEKSQADIAQVKHEYRLDDITTNKDLDARIKETELKIELVKADLQRDIESVRKEIEIVRKEISDSKNDLIKWFVGTAFAIASIGFMFARFFTHGVL